VTVTRVTVPYPVWLANTFLPSTVTDAVPVNDSDSAYRPAAGSVTVPVSRADHPLALMPGAGDLPPQDSATSGTVLVAAAVPLTVVLL